MKFDTIPSILSSALVIGLSITATQAQNNFYAPGDLVLFFQKTGDTDTVYANLGNAATAFRGAAAGAGDATNQIQFLDINAALESAFGPGWASDPDVFAGLAGVFGTSGTINTVTNGDPHRTLYISKSRGSVGTVGFADSPAWDLDLAGNTAMTTAAGGIQAQNNAFEINYNALVSVSPTSISTIDNQNPLITAGIPPVTIQNPAMGSTLEGGIQQRGTAGTFGTFGAAGTVEFALDLYRVLAKNNLGGQVAGDLRIGSYEGTVTVDTAGKVSFVAETPYRTWVLGYPALDTEAKRLSSADPDEDGVPNLLEFVLNGNPGLSKTSLLPDLVVTETNFIFSFKRRNDSESLTSLLFQYGGTLSDWTSVTIGTDSEIIGAVNIDVSFNNANTDLITITVPKSGNAMFGRLNATYPY